MTMITKLPSLMTEKAVADYLGLTTATVARLRRSGRLGCVMVGGRARYTEAILADYLEKNTRCGSTQDRSADTGSAGSQDRPSGTPAGMTPETAASVGSRCARETIARLKSGSPPSPSSSPARGRPTLVTSR